MKKEQFSLSALRPKAVSKYSYTISNQSITNISVSDKEIENSNSSEIEVLYELHPPDHSGNSLLKITFKSFI